MRKIDKFCIIVYFKDFVGRVLKIKHISHFHPFKKTYSVFLPQTSSTNLVQSTVGNYKCPGFVQLHTLPVS